MVYLDSAATTKPKKEVIGAMMPYFTDKWHNPSSLYSPSTEIKSDIERARETVAEFIGAKSSEIFFTSSGSEANCWAIKGFVDKCRADDVIPIIITTEIEHKSILECINDESLDAKVFVVGVNAVGLVDFDELKRILKGVYAQEYDVGIVNCRVLVSIQFANNEIGTIQHVEYISKLVHKYNGIFHTDAVQAFGKLDIYVDELEIDMLSASGHKIGTPKGIGFLYKKSDVKINPLIHGSQMDELRGGTENVPYIIAMAKAVELLKEEDRESIEDKADYMMQKLRRLGCGMFNGSVLYRLYNIISVTFPHRITSEALLYTLDLTGIQASAGSACDTSSIKPSHVLKAIGLSDEDAMKTIRFSLDDNITYEDIDVVIEEIEKALRVIESDWSDDIV